MNYWNNYIVYAQIFFLRVKDFLWGWRSSWCPLFQTLCLFLSFPFCRELFVPSTQAWHLLPNSPTSFLPARNSSCHSKHPDLAEGTYSIAASSHSLHMCQWGLPSPGSPWPAREADPALNWDQEPPGGIRPSCGTSISSNNSLWQVCIVCWYSDIACVMLNLCGIHQVYIKLKCLFSDI